MANISKEKYRRLKMSSPCIFTTLNLLMGIIVIYMMVIDRSNASNLFLPLLIVFAGLCDWLDGKFARKYNAETLLGKELDSLADSISFGIAPVTLVIYSLIEYAGLIGLVAVIFFPIAGVFRLARFNVTKSNGSFEGLPITIAGLILALKHLIALSLDLQGNELYIDSYLTSIIMILAAFLMISKIKFKKL